MSDQSDQNKKIDAVVEQIRSILAAYFTSHISTLFEKADDFLFESANSATSIAEQNRMFEFMSSLRVDKESIEQNFTVELREYLKPISQQKELPKKKQHKEEQAEADELSLVAQDEMDEMVTLSTISGKAASDMQEAISHLEVRLEWLGKRNLSIFHHHALRPVHICDAFQDALEDKDYERQDKLLLYKMFGDEVVSPLKNLYKDLNEFLIERGVVPKIEYHSNVNKGQSNYSAGSYDGPVEDLSDVEEIGDSAAVGPVAGGYSGGAGSAGAATPRGPAPAGGGTGQPAAQGAAGQPVTSGHPAGQVQQAIQNFVGGDPSQVDAAASSGGTGAPGGSGYFTSQEVVGALSSMQSQVEVKPGDKLEFNAAAIKRAVLSTIGEQSGGVVNKAVHHVSEKTIDFIKLIFDAIIDDKSITDAIKALLLSLQIPVIKAAMLDADFFVDDQHPARQLLDKLAEAGVGVSEHTDEVYVEISEIVQKLLKDFEEDLDVFREALDALSALVDEIYRQAQEREQKSYEEVQQAHARSIVLQEIRKITLGKELPKGIHTLVLKVWPSMMFNYFLKHGKANDEWVDMLMILSKIIESVQVSGSMSELEELGFSFDDLAKTVEHKLEANYKKKGLIKSVIDDLRSTYEEVSRQREAREAEEKEEMAETSVVEQLIAQSTAQDAAKEQETVEATDEQPEEVEQESEEEIAKRKLEKLPDTIKPGTWCIVYNGEDRPVRRLKLAIILVQDATLVFVDHMGNVVIEKDAEEFADELERDLSGVIMQHSVFDHALNSALGSISTTTKH